MPQRRNLVLTAHVQGRFGDLFGHVQKHGPKDCGKSPKVAVLSGCVLLGVLKQHAGMSEIFSFVESLWESNPRKPAAADRKPENRTHKFEPDSQVELHSLTVQPERNGQKGRLVSYSTEVGRWLVAMEDGEFFKLDSANMRLLEVKPLVLGVNETFPIAQVLISKASHLCRDADSFFTRTQTHMNARSSPCRPCKKMRLSRMRGEKCTRSSRSWARCCRAHVRTRAQLHTCTPQACMPMSTCI